MNNFLGIFFQFLKDGGLPVLFFLVLIEGNPIIGSFVPGQIIAIFVGFLISTTSVFNLYLTLIIVFLGAFIGDIIGFLIGKKIGISGLKLFKITNENPIYKSSYHFFKKYGSYSIILGREFNLTRAFIPFLAGCFKMNNYKFLFFALVSNIIWTILSIYLGYFFGFLIIDNFNFFMEFIFFLIIYLSGTIFVYLNIKKIYSKNVEIFKKYLFHNWFFLIFLKLLFIVFIYLIKWDFVNSFNEYFSFLYFPILNFLFGFLISKVFIFSFSCIFLFVLLFNKNLRLLIVYFWSLIFFLFFSYFLSFLFDNKLNLKLNLYSEQILFPILIFYIWILIKNYKNKLIINFKIFKILNFILIFILFFNFLIFFSKTNNLFLCFFLFLIGAIQTEFILLLSHYSILDNILTKIREGK